MNHSCQYGMTTIVHRGISSSKYGLRALQWTARPRRRRPHISCSATRQESIKTNSHTKPYYITTPIFYVNAAPHVGHMYSMVLADILKRWQLLQNNPAILSTGVDEHGMKIQRAADKAQTDPQAFCDQGAEMLKSLAEHANISYDHFVRTTATDHKEAVQYAWTVLEERGYIYSSKHEGWYSVSDETFYPSSGVHLIVEPSTGRKIMVSMETGKEVEWTSEVNYRFRLSKFRDRLLKFYRENPDFIDPKSRMDEVVKAVDFGLEDLSVSRPTSRLNWGIKVPSDDTQTIYVWLDALINYITKAGYPWAPGRDESGGWPADCQVIGKDIVRFHCIYWPAFLMALGVPVTKQFLVHSHWTLGKEKMAKSTGNVVNPFYAINRFGVDVMRYYLAHDGRIGQDSDYGNEFIIERYKKDLQGSLGNLASRLLRGKKWDIEASITQAHAQKTEEIIYSEIDAIRLQCELLQELPVAFKQKMDSLDMRGGLHLVIELIYKTNAFMHQMQPWNLVSDSSPATTQHLNHTLFLCSEALRLTGVLLQPFMPTKMKLLLDMLGVDQSQRTFEYAQLGAGDAYGASSVELGAGHQHTLFPPLTSNE